MYDARLPYYSRPGCTGLQDSCETSSGPHVQAKGGCVTGRSSQTLKSPTSSRHSLTFSPFLPFHPSSLKTMRAFSVLSTTLFAATAWAATITSPSQDTTWDASKIGQAVAWTWVATDPSNFSIALVNQVRSYHTSAWPTFRLPIVRIVRPL